MMAAFCEALDRADAVIVTGGLGPTQDDITREVVAELMGVTMERDQALVDRIEARFAGRGRKMSANNLRQADLPVAPRRCPNCGNRTRAHLPRRRQGALHGSRSALGDEGDARGLDPART
jgi:molybdopterin-biosynthesis enzyme MoeA-like protein